MAVNRHIVYIDPQGGSGNLGMYDYELLSRMTNDNIIFVGGKSYNYLPLKNVKCKLWFDYGHKSNSLTKGLSYIWTMVRILFLVLRTKSKVVHIQWIRLPIFDIPYYSFIKKCLGVKLVYTVHNILPHDRYKGDEDDYGKMYRLCDALMVHTKKTKEELMKDFGVNPEKIHIAPHGPLNYINDKIEIEKEISEIKSKYSLEGKTVFLMIGFQSEYKGTDLLVAAWKNSSILLASSDAVLVIAGKDTDKFISDGVTGNIIAISKKLPDIEFDAWIKLCDVLVFPYRRIEQSGVLLTVVAERKPYCTTDVGELAVPIRQNNVGWIIPEISYESIRKTLEYIQTNRQEIKEKTNDNDAWEKVAKLYDWNESALTTETVYNTIIAIYE